MVEKLEKYYENETETYFFIVGDTGIIHLLEEKGYKVERLIHNK